MRFNRTLRADGSIVCNDCGNMLTSSNLTLADLRAQVARLEKRVQELTPVVDELIKGETNTAVLPKAICPFCQSRRPYDAGATDYTRVCFGCMRESPVEEWREE